MREFAGRTAFVTGGANGIGRGIACSLARAGANVAIADIDESSLADANAAVEPFGTKVMTIPLDVSDRAAVERAADEVESAFGRVHLLFNNAGVSIGPLPVTDIAPQQWDWIFGVNVFGVVNGVSAFVPRIEAHGEGGHVVNTASIGGLQVHPVLRNGSYAMTKYAVVALSEALALQLEDTNIGVSVLCPAATRSTLSRSSRRRPERFGGPYESSVPAESRGSNLLPEALDPDDVGERVLDCIRHEEFFIFTHSDPRAWIAERNARLVAAFDSVDAYNTAHGHGPVDRAT
jgi:NAD(P)-dependent dehydrogenase (short-subunit alcohol dehydrogenase family)